MTARLLKYFILMSLAIKAQGACDQVLSVGANVASAVAAAAPGTTICLNSGNYGAVNLLNIVKSSDVILQSVSGISAVLSEVSVNGSTHLKLQNLTIGNGAIGGATTKNITIANSKFTGPLDINTQGFNNNAILVDRCQFDDINGTSYQEGRIWVHQYPAASVVVGVTITNSHFSGGCSDGVQVGAYGVQIGPGNEFTAIRQGNCVEHVDSIQGYGHSRMTVTGNYFHDVNVCIGNYDGGDGTTVTNNIFHSPGTNSTDDCVLDFLSETNVTFTHNTVIGKNSAGLRLGPGNQSGDTTGVFQNNILMAAGNINTFCSTCLFSHNLFTTSGQRGSNNLVGTPTFIGGAAPTSWSGFQLTSTSLGYRSASDGLDRGSTFFGSSTNTILSAPKNLRLTAN